jgi:hypothetical protein
LSDNPNIPWFGSHVPEYMERANLEWIKETIDWDLELRPIQEVNIDP